MSSRKGGDPATRQRICEAALKVILKRGGADVPLTDVAKAARVSRQALYLHFKDRAALFLAVAQHADEKRGLPDAIRRLEEAPTGLDALRHMAATRATLNPEIWPLARILDSVRREDPAAEITVQNRLAKRLGACRLIVEQLDRDGSLRAELEPTVAADLLWVLTSLRSWEDLVLVRGWTAAQYEERIVAALLRLLTNTPATGGSGFSKRGGAVNSQNELRTSSSPSLPRADAARAQPGDRRGAVRPRREGRDLPRRGSESPVHAGGVG